MARDVGSYFEQLTKRARGGRRLDSAGTADAQTTSPSPRAPGPTPRPAPAGRAGGGIGDVLKDILGKGRTTVTKTAKKTADRVRPPAARTSPAPPARSRTLPPEGVVTVEYSPRLDGDPDPGEVVWAWVPFEEDPEQGKDRPVIVIGRRGQNLVGVPLTTKRSDTEAQIAVGTGEWDPKRRQSFARIWRLLDLDPDRARREGSVLDRSRFDQVITAVDQYYEVRRPVSTRSEPAPDYDY